MVVICNMNTLSGHGGRFLSHQSVKDLISLNRKRLEIIKIVTMFLSIRMRNCLHVRSNRSFLEHVLWRLGSLIVVCQDPLIDLISSSQRESHWCCKMNEMHSKMSLTILELCMFQIVCVLLVCHSNFLNRNKWGSKLLLFYFLSNIPQTKGSDHNFTMIFNVHSKDSLKTPTPFFHPKWENQFFESLRLNCYSCLKKIPIIKNKGWKKNIVKLWPDP